MSQYPDKLLIMKCEECGFTTTTHADNTLVKTGGFKCPYGQDNCPYREQMTAVAKYERIDN